MVTVADLVRRKGDPDLALEVLADVRPELSGFGPLHLVEGRILRDQGEVAHARVSYGRALALDPQNAEALDALVEMAETEDDAIEAARHREALDVIPPWLGTPPRPPSNEAATPNGHAPGSVMDIEPVDPASFAPDGYAPVSETPPDMPPALAARAAAAVAGPPVDLPADLDADLHADLDLDPVAGSVEYFDSPARQEAEEEDDGEGDGFAVYTETLAELYARQGADEKAAEVYERLLDADPANDGFRARLAELRQGGEGGSLSGTEPGPHVAPGPPLFERDHEALAEEMSVQIGEAPSVTETPFVWQGDAAAASTEREGEPIGSYLADLLAWKPRTPAVPAAPATAVDPNPELESAGIVPIESLAPDAGRSP